MHGVERVSPPKDLSGVQYELDEKEKADKAAQAGGTRAEGELAAAALTA